MNNYRQNLEHELAGMIAGIGFVLVIVLGTTWALVFMLGDMFQ